MDSTSGICVEPPSTTPLKLLVKDIGAVYVLSKPVLLGQYWQIVCHVALHEIPL